MYDASRTPRQNQDSKRPTGREIYSGINLMFAKRRTCRPRLLKAGAGTSGSGPLESENAVEELAIALNRDSEYLGVRAVLASPPRQV